MATSNDIKNGSVLNLDNDLWQVIEFQHVKPGKGGAFVRTKIKNVVSGRVLDKTFNAGTKVDFATVDRSDMQYLYNDGSDYIFMNNTTYDQISVSESIIGSSKNYLLEGMTVQVASNNSVPLYVELPSSVNLKITWTEPGIQGNRSNAGNKPATLETGASIQIPLFIEEGETIKVDTRTGEYISRA